MSGEHHGPPPTPGDWVTGVVTPTGAWTIGQLWIDWGQARYAVKVGPQHCNATGLMHGGAMTTFLDAQAFVVGDELMKERHNPTISLSVDFLAPARPGDWLVATVKLVKVTRTMIVTEALATVGERVLARSNAIYSNSRGKDPA